MSSRIKTLKRDWHSKRGCKNLYSSSFDSSFAPFTSELLELACVLRLWNRGSSPSFYSILLSSISFFFPFAFLQRRQQHRSGVHDSLCCCFCLFFFFASFFHMGRITSATYVRHHIGFMLLCALPWMRCPASETKDSPSHPATPPLLAFNTPAWLTPADQDWGNAPLVSLTPFMHHLTQIVMSLLTAQRRMQSVQFSSDVMAFISYP